MGRRCAFLGSSADKQDKVITELRPKQKDPEFPGFLKFISQLSKIQAETEPRSWRDILTLSRGVYLLTCPKTLRLRH